MIEMTAPAPGTYDAGPVAPQHPRPRRLTYSSMPVQSHPIDLVDQPQGWGPMVGPWQPQDYADPAMVMGGSGVSVGYNLQPTNLADHGPGYQDLTLFEDRSSESVNAVLVGRLDTANGAGASAARYSSTISNSFGEVRGAATGDAAATLTARLQAALTGSRTRGSK